METFFEVFVSRLWALAADQLNALSSLGRRILTSGCQIRNYARRGRDRLHTLASIRTMTNKPVTFVDEPLPAPREACKRLHTGEFADEAKRLAYQESFAQGFNDLSVDYSDKIHIIEASNGGNLYGGNGTTGNEMISNDVKLYATNNDGIGITARNEGNLYCGNGTKGNKIISDSDLIYDKNKDDIGIAKDAGNANYDTSEMAIDNDDINMIDVDTTSICGASNGENLYGGYGNTANKISNDDGLYRDKNGTKDNNIEKIDNNDAAVFDNSDWDMNG